MNSPQAFEYIQTVVIGGGQAGLSVGYHLARRRLPFVILDGNARVGDSWRNRWDSLRLFTPARYDALDGMRFPAPADYFPTKNEMAEYLEAYAQRFRLPVRTATTVERVSRDRDRYIVQARDQVIAADHVVVAMASYQKPRTPGFARDLRPEIRQLHSSEYRNAAQLRDGDLLIVGAGNSGAEIAIEAARCHRVWMSGRSTGHIPFRIDGAAWRRLMAPVVFRLLFHRVLTVRTPI